MTERIRIGWLAPEDVVLPVQEIRGSITSGIWQLTSRLSDRCDILIATRPHPTLGTADATIDAIRYIRANARRDAVRARAFHRLNQAQRGLGMDDVPYAGRASYFACYARRAAARLRQEGVDVVHLHNTSQWVPHIRRALPSARIVLQMHSEWLNEIPLREGRARLAHVDRVLAVSADIARQICERYPESAAQVAVVHDGVDVGAFPPREEVRRTRGAEVEALRQRLGVGPGPVILFVGRISAEKGLHTLIEALPGILGRVPDASIVLCGSAASLRSPLPTGARRELLGHPEWRARYAEHLQRLAAPFGDRVVFAGELPAAELPLAFALADVYVQPSLFEAFGLPVAEAMASELPVVASDAGALPELVIDGETGLLVPTLQADRLADAVVRLLSDPALRRRLGQKGRRRAATTFSWDSSAEQLYAVYQELVDLSTVASTAIQQTTSPALAYR